VFGPARRYGSGRPARRTSGRRSNTGRRARRPARRARPGWLCGRHIPRTRRPERHKHTAQLRTKRSPGLLAPWWETSSRRAQPRRAPPGAFDGRKRLALPPFPGFPLTRQMTARVAAEACSGNQPSSIRAGRCGVNAGSGRPNGGLQPRARRLRAPFRNPPILARARSRASFTACWVTPRSAAISFCSFCSR